MPNKLIPPKTTTVTRTSATPLDGELFYDSDEQTFYQGDGTTLGGIKLSKDWNITDTKTANYTANNRDWIPCNTTGGTFDITAPESGTFRISDVIGNTPTTGFGVTGNEVVVIPTVGKTVMGGTTYTLDIGGVTRTFTLIGTDWRVSNG